MLYTHQRDSHLARMLFSTLYRSLFVMVERELTDSDAQMSVKAIRDGLNAVLEASTEFSAPFIGSLHVNAFIIHTIFVFISNALAFVNNRICVSMRSNLNYSPLLYQQPVFFACRSQSVCHRICMYRCTCGVICIVQE